MKSRINLVCPVSGVEADIPYADDEEGTFVPYESEEDVDLPLGWGRLAFDVVAPNPEIEGVKKAREAAVKERMDFFRSMATAPDEAGASDAQKEAQKVQRETLKKEIKSGQALKIATADTEEQIPMPEEETVVLRLQYPVLSPEAVGALVKALKDAGFPIEEVRT